MNKEQIRKQLLIKRKKLLNKKELSTIIVDKILALDIYKKTNVIALYKSMDSEVNTDNLINYALLSKKVFLPKIVHDKMIFININFDTRYYQSKIGVLEPIDQEVNQSSIPLIIIPGIAFDQKLNRLGFGKGYYDKYLYDKSIYKIGICFDCQLINKIPIDDFDIPMDMVITEKRIITKKENQ